uniref:Uncharacterized protein n=1 Tax=Kwoniella bestiolae CBS 10118 TaxID=1296100 RepID=A0A1B9G3L5_9TREE|nr:hypothetical protein I302_05426 [Kwoniella bestiolae CBS 10118]OCF25606.1 hypothetical protein I302_05426 [Kwoniella bestiolae CBS 10118]
MPRIKHPAKNLDEYKPPGPSTRPSTYPLHSSSTQSEHRLFAPDHSGRRSSMRINRIKTIKTGVPGRGSIYPRNARERIKRSSLYGLYGSESEEEEEEKEDSKDEMSSVSKRYRPVPATFESLRIMDWSMISQCIEHGFEESTPLHRPTSHFPRPIRFPPVLGRGIEVGLCKDCKKAGGDCTVSNGEDRFYGLSESLNKPPKIYKIDRKKGYLIEGKVDMRGLTEDSDDEDKKSGTDVRRERGRKKRQRVLDPDEESEEEAETSLESRESTQVNRKTRRIADTPDSIAEAETSLIDESKQNNDNRDQQDNPNTTFRSSASQGSEVISSSTHKINTLRGSSPSSSRYDPSASSRSHDSNLPTLEDDNTVVQPVQSQIQKGSEITISLNLPQSIVTSETSTKSQISDVIQTQIDRLRNKSKEQDEVIERLRREKESVIAKLGQVYMERDEAVTERD